MKKRFLFPLLFLLGILPVWVRGQEPAKPFRRGLFVSAIQEPPVLSNREAILKLVSFAKKADVQVLFVQIYYANRTWFPSRVGDPVPYRECLKSVGEDPLKVLLREAHAAGIQVHAWLNMLSLNDNGDAPLLRKYGTDILTRDAAGKRSLVDYKIDRQYFLEPGDPRVRKELATLVGEVLRGYPDLDGIQFDYLRYPDVHPVYGHTKINIQRFKETTGSVTIRNQDPVWQQWKRDQVTGLLGTFVKKARELRPGIRVSVTGCMPYPRAYHEAFQDWPSWLDRKIVDFATVMDYSPDPAQFERWILNVKSKIRDFSKMNIGIGAYRLGNEPETFSKEFRVCETADAGACVVFHYGSLVEYPALAEPLLEAERRNAKPSIRS